MVNMKGYHGISSDMYKISSFRHAPQRKPNSSPRHEGACPPSTLGGGVLSKPQMCVNSQSRAGDGLPCGEYGGDEGSQAGSLGHKITKLEI
jgi:hypothetical protein